LIRSGGNAFGYSSQRGALAGASQAHLLGQYYRKQVDVVIAEWDRGAELIVSTKSMLSSYKKNLKNRFEEFVGDAKNLRGRHPLAAIGLLFVVRSTIWEEPGAFDFLVDMLERLRNPELYDAAGLIAVERNESDFRTWESRIDLSNRQLFKDWATTPHVVTVLESRIPASLSPSKVLADLITLVLARTPVAVHIRPRELKIGRRVALEEESPTEDEEEPEE